MTYAFDRALGLDPTGEGEFRAQLDPTWGVGANLLNGGYLMALAAGAAVSEAHPDPLVVSANFLRPLPPGSATVAVQPLKAGRRVAAGRVTIGGTDGVGLDAQITTTRLERETPVWTDLAPPAIAPPEDGLRLGWDGAGQDAVGLATVLDYAFDPATSGFLAGRPGTEPVLNLWLRFADGRPVDPLGLVLFCDACPPVSFALGHFGWAPTVSMQVLVRARPAPGWCQLEARSRLIGGAFSDEEVAVWDSEGTLVAQGRQIAVPPRGR